MKEFTRWLLENGLSIASFIISLFIAIYLYILEKRRDEHQISQTEEFNKWMKEQTERQTAMIEALKKGLPKVQADELAKKVAELLPGSVQIGEIVIERGNLRIAQSFLGGGTYIEAAVFGEEGERLSTEFSKLKEGQVVKLISPDHTGVAQVKTIETEKTEAEGGSLYLFRIWLQIKG